MSAELKWHPLAELFPMLEGDEWEAFKAGVKETGGIKSNPVKYRVVDGRPQGLDGRNRLRACRELRIKPDMKKVHVKDEDVAAFILRENVHRRHLGGEGRKAVVAELKQAGLSNRAIAGELGVNESTVRGDLKNRGAQNTAPQHVKGKDGKLHPADKDGPTLCARCKRTGAVTGCPKCAAAGRAAEKKKARSKPKNGRVAFDWRAYKDHFGGLVRQGEALAKWGGAKGSNEHKKFEAQLTEIDEFYKSWHRALVNKANEAAEA